MLIVALVLALIGLVSLVTAVVTSNELIAWVCIAASVLGVVLLIVDAIRGHKHIFTTNAEVVRSWEVLQPLVSHWAMCEGCNHTYAKGSAAEQVIAGAPNPHAGE